MKNKSVKRDHQFGDENPQCSEPRGLDEFE